jgi:DNA-binding MarR family transcriptional regulator
LRAKGFIALQLDDKDNRVKYIVQTPQTRKYFAKIDECLHAARA